MKRLVIGIALFIFLVSFITAQNPICDPSEDPNIQGVYINGICYNCNDVIDLVCPEDYGADCGSVGGDADCEVITQAFWSLDGSGAINQLLVPLPEGRDVFLVVTNTGLSDGEEISFDVYEDDFLLDDYITSVTATISGGKVVATWSITEEDLEATSDYDKFYFKAEGNGLGISTKDRGDAYKYLNITTSFSGLIITQCADYLDNVSCIADAENVATGIGQRDDNGCIYFLTWQCGWLSGTCSLGSSENASADNDLSCDEANINPCIYGQTEKQGDCEAGDDFFKITYSSTQPECESWTTSPIPCPAQVRLPFFSIFNIIASLSIISVIYAFLLRRK